MGDTELEMEHFERLLDAKLDPIARAIEKLERQQEKVVEVITNQAVIIADVRNLENNFSKAIEDNAKIHDALFTRIRDAEKEMEEVKKDSGNKLWDIVKILAAGGFGGAVAWLAGKP